MKTLVKMIHGSRLFGTATPSSDHDYKAVHLPNAGDILLQRARNAINDGHLGLAKKAGESDLESFSLQKFFNLVETGQTIAIEMLFVPERFYTERPSNTWRLIVDNRDRLISQKSAGFVGYCKHQAAKYSIKSSRLNAVKATVEMLAAASERHGDNTRLEQISDEIAAFCEGYEFLNVVSRSLASGAEIPHLEICGRLVPFTVTLAYALNSALRIEKEYGKRAQAAANMGEVDWKAVSHAIRVGLEGIELMTTKKLVFPLSDAAYLLDVKLGKVPFDKVSAEIDKVLARLDTLAKTSDFPEEPDLVFMENVTLHAYHNVVSDTPRISLFAA